MGEGINLQKEFFSLEFNEMSRSKEKYYVHKPFILMGVGMGKDQVQRMFLWEIA